MALQYIIAFEKNIRVLTGDFNNIRRFPFDIVCFQERRACAIIVILKFQSFIPNFDNFYDSCSYDFALLKIIKHKA